VCKLTSKFSSTGHELILALRVAYVALPLVLHILDVKLSTSRAHIARKQGRLSIYTEAMKGFKLQYDGTDEVSEFVGRMIDYISIERPAQKSPSGKGKANSTRKCDDSGDQSLSVAPAWCTTVANDWSDVLVRQPNLYLRILLTIDLSLSKGHFPEESDFPTTLQSNRLFDTRPPLYRITLGDTSITGDSSQGITDLNHGGEWPGSEVDSINRQEHRHNNGNFPLPNRQIPIADEVVNHLPAASGDIELPMYFDDSNMPGLEGGPLLHNSGSWAHGMFAGHEQFLSSEERALQLINQS
jgi:hypothetical protein